MNKASFNQLYFQVHSVRTAMGTLPEALLAALQAHIAKPEANQNLRFQRDGVNDYPFSIGVAGLEGFPHEARAMHLFESIMTELSDDQFTDEDNELLVLAASEEMMANTDDPGYWEELEQDHELEGDYQALWDESGFKALLAQLKRVDEGELETLMVVSADSFINPYWLKSADILASEEQPNGMILGEGASVLIFSRESDSASGQLTHLTQYKETNWRQADTQPLMETQSMLAGLSLSSTDRVLINNFPSQDLAAIEDHKAKELFANISQFNQVANGHAVFGELGAASLGHYLSLTASVLTQPMQSANEGVVHLWSPWDLRIIAKVDKVSI